MRHIAGSLFALCALAACGDTVGSEPADVPAVGEIVADPGPADPGQPTPGRTWHVRCSTEMGCSGLGLGEADWCAPADLDQAAVVAALRNTDCTGVEGYDCQCNGTAGGTCPAAFTRPPAMTWTQTRCDAGTPYDLAAPEVVETVAPVCPPEGYLQVAEPCLVQACPDCSAASPTTVSQTCCAACRVQALGDACKTAWADWTECEPAGTNTCTVALACVEHARLEGKPTTNCPALTIWVWLRALSKNSRHSPSADAPSPVTRSRRRSSASLCRPANALPRPRIPSSSGFH